MCKPTKDGTSLISYCPKVRHLDNTHKQQKQNKSNV